MPNRKIIFLAGPTAIGKTEAAVYLAKKINAEIISCDSMQVYRGMDILTSQPPLALRKKIKHHLIGVIPFSREYNVSRYYRDALKKISQVFKKGKVPLFVGGAGLYLSILMNGIFSVEPQNKIIRKRLARQLKARGSRYLYEKLKESDPEAAGRIHPHDAKRIIRALEVFQGTGRKISELQKERRGLADKYELEVLCLNLPREKLYRRIEERVEEMFKQGLAGEVRKLLRMKLSRTAAYAIGIRELKGHFDGLYDLAEAKRLIKKNTRHYAKQQLTWFRKDKRIKWVNITDKEKPKAVAERLWKKLS